MNSLPDLLKALGEQVALSHTPNKDEKNPRLATTMMENDPLWKLRHALAGLALALLASVLLAAMMGSLLGDLVGGGYGTRVGVYSALLLYVVVGAAVMFVKVAQHETRPLTPGRVALWTATLWAWPALLLAGRKR